LATVTTANLVDNELRLAPLARFAVVLPAIFYLVLLIEDRINAQQLRNAGHQFHLDFHDAEVGRSAPPYHGVAPSYSLLFFLLLLLTAVAVVVACVWQHRAASAGRALGIPARHSPGWGVGAWFVPFAALWIPYIAIRDCLPPDDPRRPRVLQWWIAWLVTAGLGSTAWFLAFFSTGAALALSIPAAIACIAMIAWAPGIVIAVAAAHRDAMGATQKSDVLTG
jgi:hypothetical protein